MDTKKTLEMYRQIINGRKNNLEARQQCQRAENQKELEMLMLWEDSIEAIIDSIEKEKVNEKI